MQEGYESAPAEGIYGHAVLNLLLASGGTANLATLRASAAEAFGPSAVYRNCSGGTFDFDRLIGFLASHGKLTTDGPTVRLGAMPPCAGH